jgi:hypothetical protein
MNNDNKNMIYTARDIEEYLSGKLSASQMHAMEKAALDDPFLAEAIEGYEGIKDKDWKIQLATAQRQITETGFEAKVIPMHRSTGRWWKIAAAVFVIGSGTILTFILTKHKPREKNNQQIAQTITSSPDPVKPDDKPIIPPVTESVQPVNSPAKEKNEITSANGSVSQPNPQVLMDDKFVYRPGNPQAFDSANTNKVAQNFTAIYNQPANTAINPPAAVNNNTLSAEGLVSSKNTELSKQKSDNTNTLNRQVNAGNAISKKELNNYFTVQIVGPDNSPLPFTNISIKKDNFGTYADAKGMVRLVSTDSVLNINVKSVGYLPRSLSLRSNQPQNKIVLLEEALALNETVTIENKDIGSTGKSRRATVLTDSVVNVEPVDGWDNYNTYVANNLDIPEEMLKKDFHGEVEIVFDVKSNGTVSNIRINKSLGPAYDEAAKRLIEQGPQWKVKKGKKTSASVKVKF